MLLEDLNTKPRVIVTYPGRFQPFHQGHKAVFDILSRTFGANNVFILTSDKTDAKKSPFNFQDKVTLMTSAGVPADRIIETSNMYSLPAEFNAANTIFIAAVGSPDADRLRPDSVTTKDSTDKLGNIKPAGSSGYYKMWTGKNYVTADKHGYVVVIPEIQKNIIINGENYDVSHGTECRNLWNNIRKNPKAQAEFLQQLYGQANKTLVDIFNKIPYSTPSNEDLSPMGQSTVSPISGNLEEEAAGVGVVANKKQRKDPRYSTSLTKDVKPGAIQHALRGFRLAEAKKLTEFNPLIAAGAAAAGLATGALGTLKSYNANQQTQQKRISDEKRQAIDQAIKNKAAEEPKTNQSDAVVNEKWSKSYKKSIDCANPKGFSQRAHCAGRRARQQGKKTKSQSINESINKNNFIAYLESLLKISMAELKLDNLPPIHLHKHISADDGQATFGRYLNQDNIIHLAVIGRHPVDIFRTLAHELVHYKQNLNNELDNNSGQTGSDEENEAHAKAGIILRNFNKQHPEAINAKPLL